MLESFLLLSWGLMCERETEEGGGRRKGRVASSLCLLTALLMESVALHCGPFLSLLPPRASLCAAQEEAKTSHVVIARRFIKKRENIYF